MKFFEIFFHVDPNIGVHLPKNGAGCAQRRQCTCMHDEVLTEKGIVGVALVDKLDHQPPSTTPRKAPLNSLVSRSSAFCCLLSKQNLVILSTTPMQKKEKRTVWKKPHLNLARESKIKEGPTNIYTSVLSLDVHPRRLYKVPNKSVSWTIHRHTHKHTQQCTNNVSSICALSPAHNHSRRRSTPASFLLRDVPESRIHRPRCHERGADKRAPERCLRHALPIPRLPC